MAPPIGKLFLLIAIIAMPNLYYRAEYNVPLMLFCFGVWQSLQHRPVMVYLIIFSWLVDIYCILRSLAASQEDTTKPKIVVILQIIVFVLKIIAIVALLLVDKSTRDALNPQNMCSHINRALHGESDPKSKEQPAD